ncbi:hypothetical protein ACWCQ1_51725 [Streptomyces sp. NPDC002144]|uniref:hypothetical protein n=1 Tax=Bacillaceae TaxID=186817 RepID=UPI00203BBE2F|nr:MULTISPECIES: hypothetical protein [Niallia]MCM3032886.1 hypothetical protein [Niallia sp. MER 6]MDK8643948.1 hypothetical protein [Niallia taxi]
MKIQSITYELVNGTYEGKAYDIDRYFIVGRRPMSTHELTVYVNHLDKSISGDCIRYGSWGDIEIDEVLEMLRVVEEAGELKRPYDGYKGE